MHYFSWSGESDVVSIKSVDTLFFTLGWDRYIF
jgi:hypothetical protein